MLRAISAEVQKWRRTWFLLVTIGATLMAPLLVCIAFLLTGRTPEWNQVFSQGMTFSILMIGPLTVTLIGGQLIASEYQYDTWKLSLTTPVPRGMIYLAKWIVGFVWIMALSVLVVLGNLAVGLLLGATGQAEVWLWLKFFLLGGVGMSVMLPVYHLVTLISRNFFVTSGFGIITTFTGIFIINSKYAAIYPQSSILVMLATMTGQPIRPDMIGSWPVWIGIEVALALGALLVSTLYMQKADYR